LLDWRDDWWLDWFNAAGVDSPKPSFSQNFQFDTQLAISQAVISGQGIALLTPMFFQTEVQSGRLVQLFDLTGRHGKFWLVYSETRQNSRKIVAFRDWLLDEV
jgi:LysR family glycine cleavage system transcriptional activator